MQFTIISHGRCIMSIFKNIAFNFISKIKSCRNRCVSGVNCLDLQVWCSYLMTALFVRPHSNTLPAWQHKSLARLIETVAWYSCVPLSGQAHSARWRSNNTPDICYTFYHLFNRPICPCRNAPSVLRPFPKSIRILPLCIRNILWVPYWRCFPSPRHPSLLRWRWYSMFHQ